MKKLLSLALALVMLLGCMTITAFAEGDAIESIALDKASAELVVEQTLKLNATVIDSNLGDVSATASVEWSSSDGTVASVDNGTVTALKTGTATITVKPAGYENPAATCTVTVISGIANVKVKFEWTLTEIAARYTIDNSWDPDTLTWKETKTVAEIADQTAEFTLTNYSSKKVIGTVSFEVEEDLKDTLKSADFDENNGKTIDKAVNADNSGDETKKDNVPGNTIKATLKFDKDKFSELSATTEATKYGTYIITISAVKEDQTAPAAPEKASVSATTVTLTAVSAGKSATKYGCSTTNDAADVTVWQDSVEFTGLTAETTYYFFARYEGNDDYNEAVSDGTEIKTESAAVWSSLSASIQGFTVYYYPLLGGSNPQPDKFAYSLDGGKTFTEIEKPANGYTMADVAKYAKDGTLYYQGASLNTVRSVNSLQYTDVWAKNFDSYPSHASCDSNYLQPFILGKIDTASERVERIAMETSGAPSAAPQINGVLLKDIFSAYKTGSIGFGGTNGIFWSCVCSSSDKAYVYDCSHETWKPYLWNSTQSVLIFRSFNQK